MTQHPVNGKTPQVELLANVGAELGESPVWDTDSNTLVWVDILSRKVHRTTLEGLTTVLCETPSHVGAVAPRARGGWVLPLADGFWLLDAEEHGARPFSRLTLDSDIRFNDGKSDSAGRFLAGTTAYNERPEAGSLYQLDRHGVVVELIDGVTISNGLGWSPDGTTLYYVDTPTGRIDMFHYEAESGGVTCRRRFALIPPALGAPDGLTVDSDGGVWVALWGGGAVHRLTPDGTVDIILRLPARNVTSCTFGGTDLSTLLSTTARYGVAGDSPESDHAGGIYAVRPGFTGTPASKFAG